MVAKFCPTGMTLNNRDKSDCLSLNNRDKTILHNLILQFELMRKYPNRLSYNYVGENKEEE